LPGTIPGSRNRRRRRDPESVYYYTTMESREIIRRLLDDGWFLVNVAGSHHNYKHPEKPGKVTVPHPEKDLPIGTVKSIERQSGLKLR
jgi:predicted RNA binding protein YcfA (HicA-like mRNA interferase family)